MAIIMVMDWDGVTPEQYEQAKEIVGWEQTAPEGGLLHTATFDDKGLHCYDLCESAEALQVFVEQRLMPGVQQVGIQGQPSVQVHPLLDLFTPAFTPKVAIAV